MIEEVKWFTEQMERKLQKHAHEGKMWKETTEDWLFKKLQGEIRELLYAIMTDIPDDIIDECADVANMAMMIADNRRKKT